MWARTVGRVAAAVVAVAFVGAWVWATVPTRTAGPGRVEWVAPEDVRTVEHDTVRARGCRPVMFDAETATNLARAGVPVTGLRVGDGSVMWRVAGVFVGWADFPHTVVRACVPAHLVAAVEGAQP
jgi:hypothetical protein